MDTSRLAHPKGRPAALDKADRRRRLQAHDERESEAVRKRSNGQCEVVVRVNVSNEGQTGHLEMRCQRRAVHVHHRLGGIGVRGRGASALAHNKINCCEKCHSEIHTHILVPDGDTFRRRR